MFGTTILIFILIYLFSGIKVIKEYERGIKFTLGRFTGVMKPGLKIVFPIFQTYKRVDIRTKAVDVPYQEAITKDNIPTKINAVVYYRINDPAKAILVVEDYNYAVSQVAQTTMRNVIGEVELDELLAKREVIAKKIESIVDKATDPWGIKVEIVDLKDIQIPENMKRTIAKQAEAEREKRAVIIKSEGDVIAAENLRKAAKILSESPGALHLRTLQSINDISSDQSNTVVFVIPLEILKAFDTFNKK